MVTLSDMASNSTDKEDVTTVISGTTLGMPLQMESIGDVAFRVVWRYIAPVIFIVGMVGNILVILVMRRLAMRGNTAAVYLPLLAVADAIALFSGIIPEWMEACSIIKFKELSPVTCKLEKIIFYTSSDTAIWLLVAFTCDRFIAVCFPLRKSRLCTPCRAKFAAAVIVCMAFLKNFHVIWTRGAQYRNDGSIVKNCGYPTPAFKYFERTVRPWLVFVLVSLIPFLLILAFNLAIVYKLYAASRIKVKRSDDRKYSQTTIMCIGVCILFFITVTPSIVMYIGRKYWDRTDTDAYEISKVVTNVVVFLNHSLNFYVYCLSGRRFRRELCKLCCLKTAGSSTGHSAQYTIRGRPTTWRMQSHSASENDSNSAIRPLETKSRTSSTLGHTCA